MKIKKWCFSLLIVILSILGLHQKVDGAIQTIDPYSFYQGSDLILTDTYDKPPTIISKGFVKEDKMSIHGGILVNPSILYRYSNANRGIATDAYIEVHYYGIGNFNGQKIDAVVKYYNILFKQAYSNYFNVYPDTPVNDSFFKFSYNLYRGFNFVNIWDFENNITFQYQDGTKLPINSDNPIYLSFNSLNKGEYVGFPKNTWFRCVLNSNIDEYFQGKNYDFLKGANSNFPDGHPELLDFYKNSVIAKFFSSMNTIVLGADHGEAWVAYSAKLLWVPEPNANQPIITKSVTDEQGNDLNQKKVSCGDTVNWQVNFKVENLDKMPLKYKSLVITDKITSNLILNSEPIITDSSGDKVPTNHYNYNSLNGTITFNSIGLENLDYKGGNYTITYSTIVNDGKSISETASLVNEASINYNNTKTFYTDPVEVFLIQPKITVDVEKVTIDTKQVNKDGLPITIDLKRSDVEYLDNLDKLTYQLVVKDTTNNKEVYKKELKGNDESFIDNPNTITSEQAKVTDTMLQYRTHNQNVGWVNFANSNTMLGSNGNQLEAIELKLNNTEISGNIEYSAHVQDIGWQGYVKDGVTAGTTGKGKRIEALKVRLTGEMANKYDIEYRTFVDGVWLDWSKNDAISGTVSQSLAIEKIQVRLVTKKEISEDNYAIKKLTAKLPTNYLNKNQKVNCRIDISVVSNPNDYVIFNTSTTNLTTYGFTATEKILTNSDITANQLKYTGTIQTIRERLKPEVLEKNETLTIPISPSYNTKSGYGIERKFTMTYTTEEADLKTNLDNAFQVVTPKELLNEGSYVPYVKRGINGLINLEQTAQTTTSTMEIKTFDFPEVQSENMTGTIFTNNQVSANDSRITIGKELGFVTAGRKLYVPIWAEIKHYSLGLESTKVIGVNAVSVSITQDLNVFAQMQATYDSTTKDLDELIVIPVFPDKYNPPSNFVSNAKEWFREPLEEEWHGTKYVLNADMKTWKKK